MLQDVIHPPEPLSIEGISSPIAAQILDFCDVDGELFSEPLQCSDVSTCSATGTGGTTATTITTTTGSSVLCGYDDGCFASDFSPFPAMDVATLSALLEPLQHSDPEPDITYHSPQTQTQPQPPEMYPAYLGDQPDQFVLTDATAGGYSPESMVHLPAASAALQQGLPPVYEDCLSSLPLPVGYMDQPTSTSCSFLDTSGLSGYYHSSGLCGTGGEVGGPLGFFGGMMVGLETGLGRQDQYQRPDSGSLGMYPPEAIHRVYSSGDLQVIGDGKHLMIGSPAPLPSSSDISTTLDESTFKVGRLSVEERKEKIHRYMKKRNERNFSKKIKYACRKTLADSRPRVRGRFAKNDEFGEAATRTITGHHDFDDEEDVAVKEEEDMLDSSDILAHISGVNSFKYNYTVESWI